MQPKTSVKLDPGSFERIKRSLTILSQARNRDFTEATLDLPAEIGLQLTNRCNLRCKHCFQWNENGHHRSMTTEEQGAELPFAIVERVFRETRDARSGLFLWGGEPMYYRRWDDLTRLLEADPRWAVNCTNGLLIEEKIESLLRCSDTLVMLISVDGLHEDNDVLRGRNTFNRVMKGIDLLLDLQRQGAFRGKISVNCTIQAANVNKLYEIVEFFENRGIDSLYLNFPWYLPETVAKRMDSYFNEHFPHLRLASRAGENSWHSYTYHLDEPDIEALEQEIRRVCARTWKIRVRLQPALEQSEVRDFVIGERTTMDSRSYCYGMHNRMDVMTSGKVSTCKLFPEFQIESLKDKSVAEIWHGQSFDRFRATHHANGLMPVCSKCIVLHLHGR